jgi:hypothetical protein
MAVLYLPDLQLHVLQLLDMQQPLLFSLLSRKGCVYIHLIFNSMSSSCLTCSSLSCSPSCLAMAVLCLPDLHLHVLQLLDMQQPLLFSLLPGKGCVYLPDLQLHVLQLLDMQQPLLFSLLPGYGCVYIYLIFNSMSSSCLTCSSLSCSASCLARAVASCS